MVTARDAMAVDATYADTHETVGAAAAKMRDNKLTTLPICGDGGQLTGVLTDRDIVVKCIADGADPYTAEVGAYSQRQPATIDADESLDKAMMVMAVERVRLLPVLDSDEFVGMLSEAAVAEFMPGTVMAAMLVDQAARGR